MTTRIGWGTRIALLYGGFVAIIVILIVGSMRQDFDLVSKDYYAEEIAYQNIIDAGRNQSGLSAPARVIVTAEFVSIQFPVEFANKVVDAEIHFYSPVKTSLDKQFSKRASDGQLSFARTELNRVFYKCKIRWKSEGKSYYQETDVDLTK